MGVKCETEVVAVAFDLVADRVTDFVPVSVAVGVGGGVTVREPESVAVGVAVRTPDGDAVSVCVLKVNVNVGSEGEAVRSREKLFVSEDVFVTPKPVAALE